MISLSKKFCDKNNPVYLVIDNIIYIPFSLIGYCNVLACGFERGGVRICNNKSSQVLVQEEEEYVLEEKYDTLSGVKILERYYDNTFFSGAIDFNFYKGMEESRKINFIKILISSYAMFLNKKRGNESLQNLKKNFPFILYDSNYILIESQMPSENE
ncbi:MAG: hypothetical protein HRT68_17125 [Flavobacteriaceae bacterium]|nr:hypothetical protein [Flavobacteriaceae bacterium]